MKAGNLTIEAESSAWGRPLVAGANPAIRLMISCGQYSHRFGHPVPIYSVSESDEQWDVHGIKVICDPKSNIYLDGVAVDFKDEIMGRGFVFNNPNASHTCGCGSSFSA